MNNEEPFDTSAHSLYLPPHRAPELAEREAALRQKIECLKRERAAISLPRPSAGMEGRVSPKSGQQAGSKGGHKDMTAPPDGKREKASLFYELVSARVGDL